jgi:sulfopyruvate decarboxylase subunit beta
MNRESETGGPLAGVRREVAEQPEVRSGMDSGLDSGMDVVEALRVLAEVRTDRQVVISNQMSARLWPALSQHPLDFNYLSSTMGGAIPLGLGLALARPELEVIVLSGDGSLLMNLGCLVTVVGSGATNLTVILLDNGIYEVTGGQRTPGRSGPGELLATCPGHGFFQRAAGRYAWKAWKAQAECCWRLVRAPFLRPPRATGSGRGVSSHHDGRAGRVAAAGRGNCAMLAGNRAMSSQSVG